MTTMADEAKELSLLSKLELRIALAADDTALTTVLTTYLCPLLLKLNSPHVAVRNKVVSICTHINTRVTPESVILPVQALLTQFKEHSGVALIRYFDLLYINKTLDRIGKVEKEKCFEIFIQDVGAMETKGVPVEQRAHVLHLIVTLSNFMTLPGRGTEKDGLLRETLKITDEDANWLAEWFGKLLLLQLPPKSQSPKNWVSPGLTSSEHEFLTFFGKETIWTSQSSTNSVTLAQSRRIAAQMLASGMFKDSERFFPAVFASADTDSVLSDIGDDMLKRVVPNTDFEDRVLISRIFELFFGTTGIDARHAARPALRLKLLSYLSRSTISTTFTDEVARMIDDGLSPATMDGSDTVMQGMPTTHGSVNRKSHGLEETKLRAGLFNYIRYLARVGSSESLHKLASGIIERLKSFVEDQGHPKAAYTCTTQELESRAFAYEIIGIMAKAGPSETIIEPNLELLKWLFNSLSGDTSSSSMSISIDQALSTMLSTFAKQNLPGEIVHALEDLLLHEMRESIAAASSPDNPRRSTKYIAVRFANRCLPFDSVKARTIDLLAAGSVSGEKAEIIEEGRRGLNPYWYNMLKGTTLDPKSLRYPGFTALTKYLFYEMQTSNNVPRPSDPNNYSAVTLHLLQGEPRLFVDALLFCRLILYRELLSSSSNIINRVPLDDEWERKLNVLVSTDVAARDHIRLQLRSINNLDVQATTLIVLVRAFSNLFMTDQLATLQITPARQAEIAELYVDFLALLPDEIVAYIASDWQQLIIQTQSNNPTLRNYAARAVGVLASHPAVVNDSVTYINQKITQNKQELLTRVGNLSVNELTKLNGAILITTYFATRLSLRRGNNQEKPPYNISNSLEALFRMRARSKNLTAIEMDLFDSIIFEMAELCLYQIVTPSSFDNMASLTTLIDDIADHAKSGNERAIIALGKVSTILPEPITISGFTTDVQDIKDYTDLLPYIFYKLHKLHDIRTVESHFSVGEAFSYLSASWTSSALSTALDIACGPPTSPPRHVSASYILQRILTDCANTKPSLRKASVIWLLCLIQFCGHLPEVQNSLAACQSAFKRCLIDRDDLIQETASRGLGLVYEKGSANLKEDLVRDLMSSFSDSRSNTNKGEGREMATLAGQVHADTQLFDTGALPTTAGESVSTYKDIMSLAAEVGDSSLVYKFMAMASSNAIWSSRAAFGRFGLGGILSQSTGMDEYLATNPKVYISLFRYRFDPNEGVRNSMNAVWTSLVKDPAKIVEKYLDGIIEDLLKNIFGKEWRTRQACCAALADLVQSRPLEKYEVYLERIWNVCFKVMDDIKESVRTAATTLARTLTAVLTRTLEAGGGTSADRMLRLILPFLLSPSGLESSAKEVQYFSVKSMLDIVKKSSAKTLRPFIPELVEKLLGLMSSLEPEAVEYVRLNAKKYEVSEQKIDDMRLSSVRSSPIMEAIERCLDLLDDETMTNLQPRLEVAMKSAIALPTKVACSKVLVSLSTRQSFVFKPFADGFLKSLEKLVLDRNETVASSYAVACGYVARGASDKQILRLASFVRMLYFESVDDREAVVPRKSITSADIIKATAKHANDRFHAFAAEFLPFIFIAQYDANETIRDIYKGVWNDNVGGSRAVVLYLREIVLLSASHLESPQWVIKHTVSKAVAEATIAIASSVGLDQTSAGLLWPLLEKALAVKTWEGKEVVLTAFVKFVEKSQSYWNAKVDLQSNFTKIAIREAKRNNYEYRKHSIPLLGKYAQARKDLDLSNVIYDTLMPIVKDLGIEAEQADHVVMDGEKGPDNTNIRNAILVGCVSAISDSINNNDVGLNSEANTVEPNLIRILKSLNEIRGVKHTSGVDSAIQKSMSTLKERFPLLMQSATVREVLQPLQQ